VLDALRPDALSRRDAGFALRVSLPWIRSLPVAALSGLEVAVDGHDVAPLWIEVGERRVEVTGLSEEPGWWFVQDRIVVQSDHVLEAGAHEVRVSFRLAIPYLQIRPDEPLTLPFDSARTLDTDAAAPASSVARDVA
jgi:hypothetical protein